MATPETATEQPTEMFRATVTEAPDPTMYPELTFNKGHYDLGKCQDKVKAIYGALQKHFKDEGDPFDYVIVEVSVYDKEE